MAVIDGHELTVEVVGRAVRLEQLAWIEEIAHLGRLGDIAAAHDAARRFVVAQDEPAAFVRDLVARVRDELVTQRRREDEPASRSYAAPPAIAGMTMTSHPSGTDARVPPLVRASSSPM